VEVVASLSQGRTAAAQCGLFTYKSVPVIFEPPCTKELTACSCMKKEGVHSSKVAGHFFQTAQPFPRIHQDTFFCEGRGSSVRMATAFLAGRSGDRILWGVIFPAPPATDIRVRTASCKTVTGSVSRRQNGRGVALNTHTFPAPWLKEE